VTVQPDPHLDVRLAAPADARTAARLLHDFNGEFDTPSPGVAVLAGRLEVLLAGDRTTVFLAGRPAVGIALVPSRPNVWYDGPVLLLDELFVRPERRDGGIGSAIVRRLLAWALDVGAGAIEINVDEADSDAQRFYERHGFSGVDLDTGERAYYYSRELGSGRHPHA
jgi:GNAT superfamily N-acetyltransferase